jgi:hypothetical protein
VVSVEDVLMNEKPVNRDGSAWWILVAVAGILLAFGASELIEVLK